jgi:hypothetical protein
MAVREPLPESPINTSEYAAIADGFFAVEIHALSESRWLIRNRGAVAEFLHLANRKIADADGADLSLPVDARGQLVCVFSYGVGRTAHIVICSTELEHCRSVQVINARVAHVVSDKCEGLAHDISPHQRDLHERSLSDNADLVARVRLTTLLLDSSSADSTMAVENAVWPARGIS